MVNYYNCFLGRDQLNITVCGFSRHFKIALIHAQLTGLAILQFIAMIILGEQSIHWMARAGWLAGASLAICGILTGALTEGIIHLVFGRDLSGNTGEHDRLNINAHAEILHRVDGVLCMPSTVRTCSFITC